jgi:hypothetical protein
MRYGMPSWTVALGFAAASSVLAPAAIAEESIATETAVIKFSGYYKNLFVDSETVFPPGDRYILDLNRLRLELGGNIARNVAVDVQYDNELLLGSYLHTAQFRLQKDLATGQYWNLTNNYAEGNSYYAVQSLYRANVTLSSDTTDMRIGRQRIAWGTGRFWSPLDILNPFSPTQLERDERVGVDAALIEYKVGPLSRLSAVYAPQHAAGQSSAALRWHGNVAATDYSVVAGRFQGDRVVGLDVAGQLRDAGVRGEVTYTHPQPGASFWRGLIGFDYAFPNTLTLTGELYYNGAGATNAQEYDFAALFAGRIQNVARPYFGGYAGYEVTPLIKWTNYLVANLDDHSRYYSPAITYSLRTNLDWSVGIQLFGGKAASEYGNFKDTYYSYVQWYF